MAEDTVSDIIRSLPSRVERLEIRVDRLENSVTEIKENMVEVKTILPTLATKIDLEAYFGKVSKEIDAAVVNLLKDAIRAYPAKAGMVWSAIGALSAMVAAVVSTILIMHK